MSIPRYTHMASTDTISNSGFARAIAIASADLPDPVGPTRPTCLKRGNRNARLVPRRRGDLDQLPEEVVPAGVRDAHVGVRAHGDARRVGEVHELVLRRASGPAIVVAL